MELRKHEAERLQEANARAKKLLADDKLMRESINKRARDDREARERKDRELRERRDRERREAMRMKPNDPSHHGVFGGGSGSASPSASSMSEVCTALGNDLRGVADMPAGSSAPRERKKVKKVFRTWPGWASREDACKYSQSTATQHAESECRKNKWELSGEPAEVLGCEDCKQNTSNGEWRCEATVELTCFADGADAFELDVKRGIARALIANATPSLDSAASTWLRMQGQFGRNIPSAITSLVARMERAKIALEHLGNLERQQHDGGAATKGLAVFDGALRDAKRDLVAVAAGCR